MVNTNVITQKHVDRGLNYQKYIDLVNQLLKEGKTTGPKQNEQMLGYAQLNFQRMRRVFKTTEISKSLQAAVSGIKDPEYWVIITEGWCGDAAQSIPVFAKMAASNDNIHIKILLRDENPEVMDAYLTNGSRSIPKVVSLDANTFNEKWQWGPRPQPMQEMMIAYKNDPDMDYATFSEALHLAYARDKTQTLQKELENLII